MLSVIVIEPPDQVMLPGGLLITDRLLDQIGGLADQGRVSLDGSITRVPSSDLGELRRQLERGDDLVLVDGGAILHAPALRAVLGDDRISSGVLVARGGDGRSPGPLRLDRDGKVVVSAGSPLHEVDAANTRSMGVLRLDAGAARAVAETLDAHLHSGSDDLTEPWGRGTVDVLTAMAIEAGVRLQPIDLRRMQAFRPSGPSDALHALHRCEERDEDRAWLDAAVKAKDGWFTTFFVSPYSRFVARLAARMGLSPNQVTTLSALVGAGAAASFATGNLTGAIIGAIALQIAFMLDCVDGQLSRYTQRFSAFGAWLDSMLDRAKELLVYLGMAIGGLRADEPDMWLLLVASSALLILRHSTDIAFESTKPAPALEPATRRPLKDADGGDAGHAEGDGVTATDTTDAATAVSPETAGDGGGGTSPLRALARSRAMTWVLRFLAFPIGERFAAISLLAVFATRRTTFLVLLVWGLVAWAASITLKLARSRRWPEQPFGWVVTAVPRVLEYTTIVGIAVALPGVRPAAFALIFALGLRHYDEGYRARTIGDGRTDAVTRTLLGAWHLRIATLVLASALGAAAPVTWMLTGIVAVFATVDLVRAWLPTSNGSSR